MSAKVAKKTYKQMYHQAKASVASAVILDTTSDTVVTNPTPTITITMVTRALKGLKSTPDTKPKVSVPSISTSTTSKTTG